MTIWEVEPRLAIITSPSSEKIQNYLSILLSFNIVIKYKALCYAIFLCTVPSDCKALQNGGAVKNGVYKLNVANEFFEVFCNNDYVTIQRRYKGALTFDK